MAYTLSISPICVDSLIFHKENLAIVADAKSLPFDEVL